MSSSTSVALGPTDFSERDTTHFGWLRHTAAKMFAGQKRLSDGLDAVLERHNIPWSVTRSGARCELQFMPTLPKNGSEAKNHFDWELMYYTHLFLTNRGLLITPFHNMMLIPPVATEADIDLLIKGWDDCLAEITLETWHALRP